MPWYKVTLMILLTTSITMPPTLGAEVELSKVDRSIRKEPIWKSGKPQYCLMVMLKGDAWDYVIPGESQLGMSVLEAERRFWFVLDGDDLYMDINENGDLTDPSEKLPRLERTNEERRTAGNHSHWQIPDIKGTDGKPLITNIQINPSKNMNDARGTRIVYFTAPGRGDARTNPIFADRPEDAPILHVTGPYRLSVSVRKYYLSAQRNLSNSFHIDGHMYVDGLGSGTSFTVEASNLNCKIEFPLTDGDTKVKEMRLQNYITGPYQTAIARLPENVDDNNPVKITLSTHTTRKPPVQPVVIEKRPNELRNVRRR